MNPGGKGAIVMADRFAWAALVGTIVAMTAPLSARAGGSAGPADPPPRVFRIQVVDEETGRGVPLVELRTVNQVRYYTDSNGVVAFDEPGLMNRKVYFAIASHGYEVDKDGFGFRGKALEVKEGGSARIAIRRLNIARRIYRVTGAGIYRDSVLTGDPVPIREPLLNGQVLGQDSVVNVLFQDKIHWFWGDTNRPDYPLGNFHVPGATSELPGKGGLEPEVGVNLSYFVDDRGFARPTAPIPGEGPTWISGLVVLKDSAARERMFAAYVKVRKVLEVYERGLAEYHPQTNRFEKVVQFPDATTYAGEFPSGHTLLSQDHGVDYVYYCNPYPLIRMPADPEQLKRIESCEAFTCLKPGTRITEQKLDRGPDGALHYGWKTKTQLVLQEQQDKLISSRLVKPDELLLNLRDLDSGKAVIAHGGSVSWNEYRQRWVMIAVEARGSTSYLGEVWYAEADTLLGPWVYARKIVTHDKYSFYNPKQHPMFDQAKGRSIFFEGTYATTFSGNPDATPRYDYNQIMYQLELTDRRLALPVAVYRVPFSPGSAARLVLAASPPDREKTPPRQVLFFAPDREGIASLPVYEQYDPGKGETLRVGTGDRSPDGALVRPLFFLLPADIKDYTGATVPFYELQAEGSEERFYTVDAPPANARSRWTSKVLGRVWRNPARPRLW
jgi:hypothetical protein